MSGVYDKIRGTADTIKTGNDETVGLGNELAARAQMNKIGEAALDNRAANPPEERQAPSAPSKPMPYTDKNKPKGWKRIPDSDLEKMTKPLGSYKHGTPSVPKTGVYKLHEGEAVIPKEKNPMNAADAMRAIHGGKTPKKAVKEMHIKATDNGKHIVTHKHHHPEHHPDETHAMGDTDELAQHVADNAPQMAPQAPAADPAMGGGAPAGPAAMPGM